MPKPVKNIKPILKYFAKLFKQQVTGGNDPSDTVRIIPIHEKSDGESVYELKIRYQSAWKSRRMSIELLGERVESKSLCYKVIYDDLLVIKVPPRPITDFNDYLGHINREHAIARRIEKSIPCVYPQLGAILKKVPSIRLPSYVKPDETEKEYIDLLLKNPHLQDSLKIGEGFVFFMTLSRYQFFNQIIDSIHHAVDHARQDILKNGPQAISDFIVFESLYGDKNDSIYFRLHALMTSYDQAVETILQAAGVPWSIPERQKQEWLFSHIAGLRSEIEADNLPEGVYEQIEQMTRQLIQAQKPAIEEFRKLVHKVSKNKNFCNNRGRIKGLVTNTLTLLYRLKKNHIAIRDLKPDNMFVAVFLDGADHILAKPDAYDMGLIDMETALCFKPDNDGRIKQPLLAGTPAYGTPSHIFGNKVLRAAYQKDFPRIFYLQDMHAVSAMIFKIVTGMSLFTKTARLMLEVSHIKRKNIQDFQGLQQVYKTANRTFWKTAIAEVNEKIQKHSHRLDDVEIELPGHLKKFLIAEYAHEYKRMGYQGNAEKEKEYQLVLESFKAPVTCSFLIVFLFNRVFSAMYNPEWDDKKNGALKKAGIRPVTSPRGQ